MPTHPATPHPPPASLPTTHGTTVQLGKIKVTAATTTTTNTAGWVASSKRSQGQRQGKPSLTVSSTLLLGPPQQSGGWRTVTELCEASKRGEVFIAKAGSCEIGFETRVDGVVMEVDGEGVEVDGEGGVVEVMALAGGCAVCLLPLVFGLLTGVSVMVLMVGDITGVGRCRAGVEGEAWWRG
jgi:hypothetical protein